MREPRAGLELTIVYVFPTEQWKKYGRPFLGAMQVESYKRTMEKLLAK